MSEYELQLPDDKLDLVEMYERYRCPVEVIVPYQIPGAKRSLLQAYFESRYQGSLWNMDFPWLAVMSVTIGGTLLVSLVLFFLSIVLPNIMQIAVSLMSAFPVIFVLGAPILYPALVYVNMRMAFGDGVANKLLGPSHIGITDSGFKLYFRGRLFYNYPNLAIWQEVFHVDLIRDTKYDTMCLRFVYQTGFGRGALYVPLDGFVSRDDLRLVLEHFERYVPAEYQSSNFKKLSENGFEEVLQAYEAGVLGSLASSLSVSDTKTLPFHKMVIKALSDLKDR